MSPNDSAGKIHKTAFIASTLVLFVICLISVSGRCYIRFRVQRQVGIDDAFLLFGTGCLITAMVLLFYFVDKMYMVEALVFRLPNSEISPDFIEDSFWYHKISAIALILTWLSIVAVKFCFLFLFRKLVDRMRPMVVYWWFVTAFNAAVSAYGAGVYIAACPYFYSLKSLQCGQGTGVQSAFAFSLSQMILDIFGDLMILFLPMRLIWKIKIKWTRKLGLASSLCLTIVVILCTIARLAGLRSAGRVDSVWETYWQYVAACIGLTMTAATAFRSLFISHQADHRRQRQASNFESYWIRLKQSFRRSFIIRSWRSKSETPNGTDTALNSSKDQDIELGNIERGTITGLRSFIRGYGRTTTNASQVMRSQTLDEVEEDEDTGPLSTHKMASAGPDSRRHDKVPTDGGSGKHGKMLADKGSRGHGKMLVDEGSGRHHKMLVDEGSGKHHKMVARPEKVRTEPHDDGEYPSSAGGSDRHAGSVWPKRKSSLSNPPRTRVGMMSMLRCGGLVLSAEVEVERYRKGNKRVPGETTK